MFKKIFSFAITMAMMLSLVACQEATPESQTIYTEINGVQVEGSILDENVPMVKGSVVGSDKEYLTLAEVESMGYIVTYENDKIVITKVAELEPAPDSLPEPENGSEGSDVPDSSESTDATTPETEQETENGEAYSDNEVTEPESTETPDAPVNSETPEVPETSDETENTDTSVETEPETENNGESSDAEVTVEPEKPVHTHSYTSEVIAPTTSSEGYTLHICSCGDSYKDNYTDKLVEEKPDFENTGGQGEQVSDEKTGSPIIAGQMVDRTDIQRPVFDKSWHKEQLIDALNGYVGTIYHRRFFSQGICKNSNDEGKFAKIVQRDDGTFGVNVFGWRKSYDSDVATNSALNMVMEAFYLLSGDRNVAYALWSAEDEMSINGSANTDDFGFKDVAYTSTGFIMEMNGIQIEVESGGDNTTFWFLNTK